jgi:tRNA threonylcarbamoyl adenosine modification protein YjeE
MKAFADTILLTDIAATETLAGGLAPLVGATDVIALHGDLGAGKTTFVRALLRVLGIEGEVPSPTYTLMQTYESAAFPVYHFDLYRLKKAEELEEIGFDDACADGLVLIEWPERAGTFMPKDRLDLRFSFDERGGRQVSLLPQGRWKDRLA